jgi:hypothetical protein
MSKRRTDYCYGHSVKRGVGNYTDNDPGLTPYRGVDQNGNPVGAIPRGRRGPETPVPEANEGFAAKLPKR